MEHEDLFNKLDRRIKEIKRIDEENPTGPDETDPRIEKLLEECAAITKELDPIVRLVYRNHPAKLAAWDEIIHSCDDDEETDSDKT